MVSRVFGSKCFILNTKDYLTKFDPKSYEGVFLGFSQNSKAYIILNKHTKKIKESLNVTLDETPPPSKTSPLVDDDLDEEEAIRETEKKNLENIVEDETLYVTQPPGFIDFEKPNHVYKLKKALYGLKQAPKAWYDRLKAFLIKHEYKMGMVDNTLFTKKKSSNLIIVQIYVDDIIFGSTCQDMCDEFAKIMHDEFEMSMMGELNFFLGLQIKQMEDGIFFNQSKYIKEMLKKFGLEDSKPMKTPMSSDTKLTKDEECESIDSTKYRGMIGTTHLGLWYPKGTGIETVVYADSDHAGDYVDRKSTSGEMTLEDELRYTKSYVPTISNENYIPDILKPIIRNLECRSIHEGRPISPESTKYDNIQTLFQVIKLLKIYELHEEICPRFLLEFYSSIEITKDDNLNFFLTFWALKRTFKFSLESFASILSIPCEGECSYSEEPSLDSLKTNQESNTPYQTHILTPSAIIQSITTTG
ncbi:retrovirus-related pol polyprotein from transposon TNT 1-94 [Tanacetum coccineum]